MELHLIQTVVYCLLIFLFFKRTNGFVQKDVLVYCTLKTLPVLSLSIFTFYGLNEFTTQRRLGFAFGLLFGAIGDFLLSSGGSGFLLGALSFAVGHILYMIYFGPHMESLSLTILALCAIYTFLTDYYVIVPHFYRYKKLFWILIVYSVIICSGMVLAISLYLNGASNGASGDDYKTLALGYLLFAISDTCIVMRVIGYKSKYLHEFILFTYFASQYLIYKTAISSQHNIIV